VVRLLPSFDGLWVGYHDHHVFLTREYRPRVFPGGGIIRPLVFANSQIVGTWTRRASVSTSQSTCSNQLTRMRSPGP
jgi:Winged helix DNA-binding domain